MENLRQINETIVKKSMKIKCKIFQNRAWRCVGPSWDLLGCLIGVLARLQERLSGHWYRNWQKHKKGEVNHQFVSFNLQTFRQRLIHERRASWTQAVVADLARWRRWLGSHWKGVHARRSMYSMWLQQIQRWIYTDTVESEGQAPALQTMHGDFEESRYTFRVQCVQFMETSFGFRYRHAAPAFISTSKMLSMHGTP